MIYKLGIEKENKIMHPLYSEREHFVGFKQITVYIPLFVYSVFRFLYQDLEAYRQS